VTTRNLLQRGWRFVAPVVLGILVSMAPSTPVRAQGPGGPAGVSIKIRAINRSTTDRPFCAAGGGMVGDRLDVDAFIDVDGTVEGTARFENAVHQVTVIELDRAFAFFGGILLQNFASQETVPIWMTDAVSGAAWAPALVLVNVELPRGCTNTVSTFTPGVDKVTMEIKFK
jgi:hypothetical protein